MGLFHKKLTDALVAIKQKDFPNALKILEKHEQEDVVFSSTFKELATDIENYDTSLRMAIAELKSTSKVHIAASNHIEDSLKALKRLKKKLRDLLAEDIKLE
mgnify:CR=1 FL=1